MTTRTSTFISLTLIALLGVSAIGTAQENTWAKKADMPTGRNGLSTAVVEGKIYAIGGWDGSQILSTVETYDPVTGTWTKRADMRAPRAFLSSAVVDGKIYAIGGWDRSQNISTVQAYDPATDTWTKRADMPTARAGLVPFSAPPKRGAVLWSNAPKTKGNSIGYRNGNESYQHDSINGPPRLETATVKNVVPVSGWLTPKRTGDSKHPLRRRLSF